MSGFLLDTNIVSEPRKKDQADGRVRRWMDEHAAEALMRWLSSTIEDYTDRILPVTVAISQRWALISVADPVPLVDGLLAATVIEHDLALVTRNVNDVRRTGVAVVNPFDPS